MASFKLAAICLMVVAVAVAVPRAGEKRLIKTSADQPGVWMTQDQIISLAVKNVNFMDITGRHFPAKKLVDTRAIPTELRFADTVNAVLPKLSSSRIEEFIVHFSSYHNRHYNSDTGVEAAEWLLDQINEIIVSNSYENRASGLFVEHTWRQNSVIARIEGTDPELKAEVVVLGGHFDSIAGGQNSAAPGADDNASGSAALLETFRGLLESGFTPKRTVEFQWYAAEEVGLLGSADIAEAYSDQGIEVVSMLNFDVVGYYTAGRNEISFLTDYTSSALNAFLRKVVEGYLTVPWQNSVCGYGCSDHASWTEYGFPSASPSEPVLSPYMHTTRDVIATVSFDQVREFSRLAAGYVVEIAEPSSA